MNQKKENPIAVQSKQWILKALLELMEEKDYQSISIKELAERADLDRKTFYRNFQSKDEVIIMKLQELCERYIEELQALPQLSTHDGTKAYFNICIAHAHFFQLLRRNNLLPLVLLKFNEYLPAINEVFLSNPEYKNKSKYELVYQAGGFWNVTARWLEDGAKETAEEMAAVVGSIMPPLLKQ